MNGPRSFTVDDDKKILKIQHIWAYGVTPGGYFPMPYSLESFHRADVKS